MTTLQTLSLMIHGPSKQGKSTLAASAPGPVLIADAEGGSKFLPYRMVGWDPRVGPPPVHDGTWDICVVVVNEWSTVQRIYEWLSQSEHSFNSFVLDSITELQRRCKATISDDAFKIQDWNSLLIAMDKTLRGFRDLTLNPSNPIKCAVFIAETRMKDGRWTPFLQGSIEVSAPYWFDVVGYLYAQPGDDGSLTRQLLISPHPQYVTGERVGGRLPNVIASPNLTDMFNAVYPPAPKTAAAKPAASATPTK